MPPLRFYLDHRQLTLTQMPHWVNVRSMETTLHRQLKTHYADLCTSGQAEIEARFGSYRIDILDGDRLIEVQHSGLSSIRNKTSALLKKHKVEIIKPLIARKRLIKLDEKDGNVISQRWSPKRGTRLDLFHELIYFTKVFPHRRLTMRMPLIVIEELRYPHRRRRRNRGQFKVQDQRLVEIVSEDVYRTIGDLRAMLPHSLPQPFGTKQLAEEMEIERWFAQRIAYCLRETGAAKVAGKLGNSIQYKFPAKRKSKPIAKSRKDAA